MSFQIISGTAVQEFIETAESAAAALDRVRELTRQRAPNVRVLNASGRRSSLAELEGLAEFENESDDA